MKESRRVERPRARRRQGKKRKRASRRLNAEDRENELDAKLLKQALENRKSIPWKEAKKQLPQS